MGAPGAGTHIANIPRTISSKPFIIQANQNRRRRGDFIGSGVLC